MTLPNRTLTSAELKSAVVSTLEHLSTVVPTTSRRELQRVLAHIVVAALADEQPEFVASYFLKCTLMLDGKYDQGVGA